VAGSYHSLHSQDRRSEEKLASFLQKSGQQLLPMIDLIEQSRVAVEELIDTVGRVMLETVLVVSAEQVAGVRQPGKARRDRGVVRAAARARVSARSQAGGGASPTPAARAGPRPRSGGTRLSSLAKSKGHAKPDAGNPVERRFHSELSAGKCSAVTMGTTALPVIYGHCSESIKPWNVTGAQC
jgi:hypothetical protein